MKKSLLTRLKRTLFLLPALLVVFQANAQSWTPKYSFIGTGSNGYYEYLPVGYDGVKKFPVIVFLHGLGEQGNGTTQLSRMLNAGLPKLINQGGFPQSVVSGGKSFSFIVIAPQFYGWPSADNVDKVINDVVSKYSVDPSRIYLTGLSMGGGATWDHAGMSSASASRLAAIVPNCGASYPDATRIKNIAQANLPVLATHNNGDPTVSVSNTNGYVDGINAFSPNPLAIKLIWSDASHNCWDRTYDPANKIVGGLNCYEWMLQYTRGVPPPLPPPPPPGPAPVTASISSSTNVSCFGASNGSATASASGGTAPYTYSWNTSPVQTTATASNLAAGSYEVLVKDVNGNGLRVNVTIGQPSAALALTVNAGTISTNGGSTSVTLGATGGTAPYTFSGPTSNVKAGTYNYTVTDAKGCTDSKSITITEPAPAPPPPPPPPSALSVSFISHTDVTCKGATNGRASASAAGGIAPYTYTWNSSPAQITANATGLSSGTYTVTVKDAVNATTTATVTILEPNSLSLSAQAGTINIFGGTTSVTLSAAGGTAPYMYEGQVTNVTVGSYTYIVTDANGCKASTSLTIAEPSQIILSARSAGIKCNGGTTSVYLAASGGVAPYSYIGDTINVQAGTYSYSVTDAKGAKATTTLIVSEPVPLVLTVIPGTITAIGGTTNVTLTAAGGTPQYIYTGVTSALKAGTYTYQVKDANGCGASAIADIREPGVNLSALTVTSSDTIVNVNWTTNYEFGIDRFEVEKAKDNKTFVLISRLKSKGSSVQTLTRDYVAQDASTISGSNTYKLYAVTLYGQRILLGEKKLFFADKGSVKVKNLTNQLQITVTSGTEEKVNVLMYDISGRPISQNTYYKTQNVLREIIPMDNLKSGVYIVKILTQSGLEVVKQVAKQ
jgi:predicted esterase